MSDQAVQFLTGFAQALSALALYPEGHASRERAVDQAHTKLLELYQTDPSPEFSFLGDEVIYGAQPLRELQGWDWSRRLAEVSVQRLQFDQSVTLDEFEGFLAEVLARLTLRAVDTSTARQMGSSAIRYGTVGIRGEDPGQQDSVIPTAKLDLTLGEEAEAVRWLHAEIESGHALPLQEAETVVRALSAAMHGDQQIVLPLLRLREFDEYTTTHSLNVAVLAMGLAERMNLGARNVRAFGLAGLLHDLGKVKIPKDILTKPGKLSAEERDIMNMHPVEGARMIISTEKDMDLAAVVAYEHHVMLDGGGYPAFKYKRKCDDASRLVHVCDVYDALRTKRPYRDAWPSEKVLAYVDERAGTEFDVGMAHTFTQMMREREAAVAVNEVEAS